MNRPMVLVTGASGFVGTNLVGFLLEDNYQVIALDIRAPQRTYAGYEQGVWSGEGKTEFDLMTVKGDVRDPKLLGEIFSLPVDYVIHLAAVSTIQMGMQDEERTINVNVGGTESLLKAVREHGDIKGFLYASTDKVYGRMEAEAYTEQDELTPLDSPYDRSKAQADEMVRQWSERFGIHGVVLRFCNLYGSYDMHDTRIVPATIRAGLEGRRGILRMYRDEKGCLQNFKRDLLYIDDLCKVVGKIIRNMELWNREENLLDAPWGEAFNLGAIRTYSMDDVIRRIHRIMGIAQAPEIEICEDQMEIPSQRMDYAKAKRYFDFEPETSLEDGLMKTAAWWKGRWTNCSRNLLTGGRVSVWQGSVKR